MTDSRDSPLSEEETERLKKALAEQREFLGSAPLSKEEREAWSASTTAAMAKRYGHIGAEAQRAALDTLVEPRPAPRWSDASSF